MQLVSPNPSRFYLSSASFASWRFNCLLFCHFGGSFPYSRRAMPIAPQQRLAPLLSPRLCQDGGASRASRRSLWRKSRHSAPFPLLPAAHPGDNSANFAIDRYNIPLPNLS